MLDEILIIDVEATCWDNRDSKNSEIIEVGLSNVNLKTMKIDYKTSMMIKPVNTEISPYCTRLTGITPAMVSDGNGIHLECACDVLRQDYLSHARVWGSYGNYDREIFKRNCDAQGIEYPFSNSHLNIKTIAALFGRFSKEVGLKKALERYGLNFEGSHHRGVDDAYNIARLFLKILWKR